MSTGLSQRYRHRQPAILLYAVFGVFALAAIVIAPASTIVWLVIAILALVAFLFSSLTIGISADSLDWSFGPGWIRKQVAIDDIVAAEATRARWWEGWGIRYTSRGWLYNVSGLDAVLVTLESGKTILLGTDEPERLAAAINAART